MKTTLSKQYESRRPLAVLPLSNFGGLAILDILSEHAVEFSPPEYSESERRAQFDRLTEENPVSIFEGVSL